MRTKIAYGLCVALIATAVVAETQSNRRAAMDQIRAGAATLVPMMKGKTEFNAQTAELGLRMTYAGAIAFHGPLFPEGSQSKGTNPAIWTNKADFDAKRTEFLANAAAAVVEFPVDVEGLKASYQPLLDNCAACHKAYRIK
jgi:cytochrome c556